MTPTLTPEQITQKAAELSDKLQVKVIPFSFTTKEGDQIVGYLSEPKRQAKMAALDMMMKSATGAGEMLLGACLIKEESNSRLSSIKSEDDAVVISAQMECLTLLEAYANDLKKK